MEDNDKKYSITELYDVNKITWGDIRKLVVAKLTNQKPSLAQKVFLSALVLVFGGYGITNAYFSSNSYTIEMPGEYLDASIFSKDGHKTGVHSLSVRHVDVTSFPRYIAVKILNRGHNDFVEEVAVSEKNQQKNMSIGDDMYDMQMTAYLAVRGYQGQRVPFTQKVIVTDVTTGGNVPPNVLPSDEILTIDGKKIRDHRDIELAQLDYTERRLEIKRGGKAFRLNSSLYGVKTKRVISLKTLIDYRDFYKFANLELRGITGRSAGASLALHAYASTVRDVTAGLDVAVTGTVDPYGNIGFITGVTQKTILAIQNNSDVLFVPKDNVFLQNETEARKVKKKLNSDIKIVGVDTLSDMINYLDMGVVN